MKLERYDEVFLSVEEALLMLGDDKMIHSMNGYDESKALVGEELITKGCRTKDGVSSDRISSYYVCTDCHNLGREFKDLSSQSAEDRLDYAIKHHLPYLQASSFFGIYNRTGFFSGDYASKYGDMVYDARDTLENAVQLCAKYCASGRFLEDWELEAIMHYFKKNELMLSDLEMSNFDSNKLLDDKSLSEGEKKEIMKRLKQLYVQEYAATFMPAMDVNERKYGEGGDPLRGKIIFEISCLHCHENGRVARLDLSHDWFTARMFWWFRKGYSNKSIYQIVRMGTNTTDSKKLYMPNYTKEKMSDEQINDLMAYIRQRAGKDD